MQQLIQKILIAEEWKKRRNLLPTYVSSFSEAAKAENKNREEEEILKNEKMMELINKKKNYCKILKEDQNKALKEKEDKLKKQEELKKKKFEKEKRNK